MSRAAASRTAPHSATPIASPLQLLIPLNYASSSIKFLQDCTSSLNILPPKSFTNSSQNYSHQELPPQSEFVQFSPASMQLKLHYTNNPLTVTTYNKILSSWAWEFPASSGNCSGGDPQHTVPGFTPRRPSCSLQRRFRREGRFSSGWKVAAPRAEKVWKNGVILMSGWRFRVQTLSLHWCN
jgi:hypothetical protein